MRKLVLVLLAAAAIMAVSADASRAAVASHIIRLHVVANSDTEADQAYKLEVRDRVLGVVGDLTAEAGTREQAETLIRANLERIRAAAGENTAVSLRARTFPSRDYGLFALPAGSYTALTVTIGEGRGQNWWCVVFPPLCASATQEEFSQAALEAGLTEDEIAFITGGEGETVVIKFKTLEILQKIFNR